MCLTSIQFIAGGCEISLIAAIDFTGSNGDPATPGSLHYIDRSFTSLNQYQQAIQAVGRVVEEYDTDKLFPVFGFGARVRQPDGQFSPVQHCFPVYGGGGEVRGVDGIMRVGFILMLDFCSYGIWLGLLRCFVTCCVVRTNFVCPTYSNCDGHSGCKSMLVGL